MAALDQLDEATARRTAKVDPLCDEDSAHGVALFFCPTCKAHYCPVCDTDAHDGVGSQTHKRVEYVLRVVSCDGIQNGGCPHPATVVCADAQGNVLCGHLCAACDTEKHAKGVKAKHLPRKPLSQRVRESSSRVVGRDLVA